MAAEVDISKSRSYLRSTGLPSSADPLIASVKGGPKCTTVLTIGLYCQPTCSTGRRQLGLPSPDKNLKSPLSPDILNTKVSRKFNFPQITPFDGKTDPVNHVRRHITSLLERGVSKNLQCLLFPMTLNGIASNWFHSLSPGSITSFKQLHELFIQRFAATRRVKSDLNELFTLEQKEGETLRAWYECFIKVITEIESLTPHEGMSAFQRGSYGVLAFYSKGVLTFNFDGFSYLSLRTTFLTFYPRAYGVGIPHICLGTTTIVFYNSGSWHFLSTANDLSLSTPALSNQNSRKSIEDFLDGSLRTLDVCGTLQEAFSQVKGSLRELESSLRRKATLADELEIYIRSRKNMKKALQDTAELEKDGEAEVPTKRR
ncbi:hypothetical protein CRG98_024445 [Punica granatum]|uniref:Retrotransposon gag domain-containing protein n=1 Tax=Punica granatum TaxID=22663 RepID=A0A2I0JFY1_PUNGR|nr:hypothetical protein CRG98_024445 [Punica granatum]